MHALKILPLALLWAACGGSDDHHETGSTDHHATEATESTHASHEEAGEHGDGSTDSSTGHSHAPTTGDHHESTGEHHGSETGPSDDPVVAYCDCMVVYCHDEYHGTWGEEHPMSEINCQAAAAMVPSVGMPASSGNSIECRLSYCEAAADDLTACASAIGGGMCM